jgi:polyhydroxybutyrate depolymerase
MPGLPWVAALFLAILGATAARAQLTTKTLVYQDVTRTWFEHIPLSYNGSHAVPLVLVLHGFNSSGDQFAGQSEWIPKADAAGFIAVFPNGGIPVDKSFAWHAFAKPGEAPDDAGFLLVLIEKLKKDYPIDPSRVYMTGFSNGGGMASAFAHLHAHLLAGIAPVSGGWHEDPGAVAPSSPPDAPMPVWVWRGTAEKLDQSISALMQMDQEQIQFWVTADGDKSTPQAYHQGPYTTYIYRGGKAEVRNTIIDGAEHAYQPGISEKIWDGFFSVFSRQGTAIVYHPPK